MQAKVIDDYSAGIADSYLSSPPKSYYIADNLLLDENSNPYTRWGISVHPNRLSSGINDIRVTGILIGEAPFSTPIFIQGPTITRVKNDNTLTTIAGQGGHLGLPAKLDTSYESSLLWRNQRIICYPEGLPARLVCTALAGQTYTVFTLGAPTPPAGLILTPASAGTVYSYIYWITFNFTFTDYLGTTYQDESEPYLLKTSANVQVDNAGNKIALSSIPVLANSASTNYLLTAFTKNIYRTNGNGTAPYLVTSLANATTSYDDVLTDALLVLKQPAYFNGGALYYTAPISGLKYVTQIDDTFWYANDTTLYQSVNGVPGGLPGGSSTPTDQKIFGLNFIQSFPILFCEKVIYRVENQYDDFGNNGYQFRDISQTAGCISNRSIVKVPGGLVWAGLGGFFSTDGYSVLKISKQLPVRYPVWANSSMVGIYDPIRNIVQWTASSSLSGFSGVNDIIVTLHLNYGITETSVFTTQSHVNNIYPTTIAYSSAPSLGSAYRMNLLIGEARGYFLTQSPQNWSDIIIDVNRLPSVWDVTPIIYDFRSMGHQMSDDSVRMWTAQVSAEFSTDSQLSVTLMSRPDDGGPWGQMAEIRYDGPITWELSDVVWNDTNYDHPWNSQPITNGIRKVAANQIRSIRRQVRITNSLTAIQNSDSLGLATVDAVTKTITLNDPTQIWDAYIVGYQFYLQTDGYLQSYQVITRNSATVVTVIDMYSTLVNSSTAQWLVKGYRKNERMQLLSYTLYSEVDGTTMPGAKGQVGLNAN